MFKRWLVTLLLLCFALTLTQTFLPEDVSAGGRARPVYTSANGVNYQVLSRDFVRLLDIPAGDGHNRFEILYRRGDDHAAEIADRAGASIARYVRSITPFYGPELATRTGHGYQVIIENDELFLNGSTVEEAVTSYYSDLGTQSTVTAIVIPARTVTDLRHSLPHELGHAYQYGNGIGPGFGDHDWIFEGLATLHELETGNRVPFWTRNLLINSRYIIDSGVRNPVANNLEPLLLYYFPHFSLITPDRSRPDIPADPQVRMLYPYSARGFFEWLRLTVGADRLRRIVSEFMNRADRARNADPDRSYTYILKAAFERQGVNLAYELNRMRTRAYLTTPAIKDAMRTQARSEGVLDASEGGGWKEVFISPNHTATQFRMVYPEPGSRTFEIDTRSRSEAYEVLDNPRKGRTFVTNGQGEVVYDLTNVYGRMLVPVYNNEPLAVISTDFGSTRSTIFRDVLMVRSRPETAEQIRSCESGFAGAPLVNLTGEAGQQGSTAIRGSDDGVRCGPGGGAVVSPEQGTTTVGTPGSVPTTTRPTSTVPTETGRSETTTRETTTQRGDRRTTSTQTTTTQPERRRREQTRTDRSERTRTNEETSRRRENRERQRERNREHRERQQRRENRRNREPQTDRDRLRRKIEDEECLRDRTHLPSWVWWLAGGGAAVLGGLTANEVLADAIAIPVGAMTAEAMRNWLAASGFSLGPDGGLIDSLGRPVIDPTGGPVRAVNSTPAGGDGVVDQPGGVVDNVGLQDSQGHPLTEIPPYRNPAPSGSSFAVQPAISSPASDSITLYENGVPRGGTLTFEEAGLRYMDGQLYFEGRDGEFRNVNGRTMLEELLDDVIDRAVDRVIDDMPVEEIQQLLGRGNQASNGCGCGASGGGSRIASVIANPLLSRWPGLFTGDVVIGDSGDGSQNSGPRRAPTPSPSPTPIPDGGSVPSGDMVDIVWSRWQLQRRGNPRQNCYEIRANTNRGGELRRLGGRARIYSYGNSWRVESSIEVEYHRDNSSPLVGREELKMEGRAYFEGTFSTRNTRLSDISTMFDGTFCITRSSGQTCVPLGNIGIENQTIRITPNSRYFHLVATMPGVPSFTVDIPRRSG